MLDRGGRADCGFSHHQARIAAIIITALTGRDVAPPLAGELVIHLLPVEHVGLAEDLYPVTGNILDVNHLHKNDSDKLIFLNRKIPGSDSGYRPTPLVERTNPQTRMMFRSDQVPARIKQTADC